MRQWRESEPCIIERAERFELIDTEGRRYIDAFSSLWCNVHGHGVAEIDGAIREQLSKVAHSTLLGLANVPSIELASRLVRLANRQVGNASERELNKVFFSDAGATATELAFKMVIGWQYHSGRPERDTLIGFSGAYHGDTVGAMSVGYMDAFHKPFGKLTFRCAWSPAPDVARSGSPTNEDGEWPSWDMARRAQVRDHALARFKRTLDEIGERCAGVVIEPLMQGAAGMIEQPEGFLSGVARLTRDAGVPLIADEVAVGLGRTGAMFASEHENVRPDVLCVAKGLSGGYLPLAATLCTDEIAEAFEGEPDEHKTLYHGHTYTGNPLGCAAAIATLDLLETNNVLANVENIAHLIHNELRDRLRDHPNVGDVRQRGVLTGIELVAHRRPWRSFDAARRVGAKVCRAARARGLMVRPLGDVIILNPAPAMDQETVGRMLTILIEVIKSFDFDHAAR